MTFRRRTFPEIVEYLLTSITGGVAGESHPFPPPGTASPPFRHSLQQPPVASVVSVYGSLDGQPHLFRKDADYRLLDDQQTVEWQAGGQLPDPGTLVSINYLPTSARAAVNDLQVGSVVRTLAESVALEIARLYAQLEAVYQSGFIDTATGSALDNVVALLGMERVRGGRPAGEVEFTRAPGSRGSITIPAGTRIITPDGNVEYETTDTVTLAEGQSAIRVVARDLEDNAPLPADSLTVLPVPITGIASVTNPAPTAITAQNETDEELRTRAKNFLHGSERATLGAIKEAIARQGITADVEEVKDAFGQIERVDITPHAQALPPELDQRLRTAIEATRPAGMLVKLKQAEPPRKVDLKLRLTTRSGLLEQDLRAVQRSVRGKIEDYFARLPAREAGSINRIVGLVLGLPEVEDMRILEASWSFNGTVQDVLDLANGQLAIGGFPTVLGKLQITDPNLPTRLQAIVTYPEDEAPPDRPQVQSALANAVIYLNDINASEAATDARRQLSYGKLLRVVPLPGKPGESLEDYDDAVDAGGPVPTLPDESAISPYQVQFVFTLESGLSRIISQASDPAYVLTPFERLSLDSVEVQAEAISG